jgi:hypothetical protein
MHKVIINWNWILWKIAIFISLSFVVGFIFDNLLKGLAIMASYSLFRIIVDSHNNYGHFIEYDIEYKDSK